VDDPDADLSYLEQDYADCTPEEQEQYKAQDAARLDNYGQDWYTLGIKADVSIKTATNWVVPPVVGRASLWGIESDSGEEYLKSVEEDLIVEALEDAERTREALNARAVAQVAV
jgi:hypothetical protein